MPEVGDAAPASAARVCICVCWPCSPSPLGGASWSTDPSAYFHHLRVVNISCCVILECTNNEVNPVVGSTSTLQCRVVRRFVVFCRFVLSCFKYNMIPTEWRKSI